MLKKQVIRMLNVVDPLAGLPEPRNDVLTLLRGRRPRPSCLKGSKRHHVNVEPVWECEWMSIGYEIELTLMQLLIAHHRIEQVWIHQWTIGGDTYHGFCAKAASGLVIAIQHVSLATSKAGDSDPCTEAFDGIVAR